MQRIVIVPGGGRDDLSKTTEFFSRRPQRGEIGRLKDHYALPESDQPLGWEKKEKKINRKTS